MATGTPTREDDPRPERGSSSPTGSPAGAVTPRQRAGAPRGGPDGRTTGPGTGPGAEGAAGLRARIAGHARRHRVFLGLLLAAVAARVTMIVAYPSALKYLGDSAAYLDQATNGLWPGDWRPSGYPMFLIVTGGRTHLTWLTVVQHLLTLLAAVALYAAACRALRRPWLAALAAAPALLHPWVLDLGHFVLADSLFGTLVALGVALLALLPSASSPSTSSPSAPPPSASAPPGSRSGTPPAGGPGRRRAALLCCAAAGLLLGASLTVRTVGYGPLAVGLVGLVGILLAERARSPRRPARPGARPGVRPALALAGAFALAAAVPVVSYSAWSASRGGDFSVSAHSGFFLYGRVAPFADCSVLSSDELRTLCDPRPVEERGAPVTYLWPDDSLLRQGNDDVPPGREELAGEFAREVILAQPGMMISTSARYLAGYFLPVRYETRLTSRADTWEMPTEPTNRLPADHPHTHDGYFVADELRDPPAGALAAYSRLSYAPMPLVGLGLLAGVAAWLAARLRGGDGPGRLFWLAAGAGLSPLVLSSLTSGFDYRYLGSVIGLLALAAVVGFASLWRAARSRPAAPSSPAAPPAF